MKDLHSHLLFGIDDGSKSLDESICLLKKMQEQNITDLICTPHYIENSKYVCNNKDKLKKIKKLKEKIRKENININLYLGNELFITPNVVDLINKKEVVDLRISPSYFTSSYIVLLSLCLLKLLAIEYFKEVPITL